MGSLVALCLTAVVAGGAHQPRLAIAAAVGMPPLLVAIVLVWSPPVEPSAAWLGLLLALLGVVLRRPPLPTWPLRLVPMAALAVMAALLGRATGEAAISLAVRLPAEAAPWLLAGCAAGWIAIGTLAAMRLAGHGFPWEFAGLHAAGAATLLAGVNEAPAFALAAEAAAAVAVVAGVRSGSPAGIAMGLAGATIMLRMGAWA